jgi:putative sigma-54 modulation protein
VHFSIGNLAMKITISTHQVVLSPDDSSLVMRRLFYALSRFAPRIARVTAVISDENGPRGGIDTTCRLILKLQNGGQLVVEDRAAEPIVAVGGAAERVARKLARLVTRRRDAARSTAAVQKLLTA